MVNYFNFLYRFKCLLIVMSLLASNKLTAQHLTYSPRGNRYEGTKTLQVHNSVNVKIIGFHRDPVWYDFESDLNLYVHYFVPLKKRMNIRFLAQEKFLEHAYFMQPFIKELGQEYGYNTFGPWNIDDVIRPLEIDSSNLMSLITVYDRNGILIASPAQLSINKAPTFNSETRYELFYTLGNNSKWNKIEFYLASKFEDNTFKIGKMKCSKKIGRRRANGVVSFIIRGDFEESWYLARFESKHSVSNKSYFHDMYFYHSK